MLNHIERWRFLEQPARKHRTPHQFGIGGRALLDKNLHKGPGFERRFPWQALFASLNFDHNIAKTPRFAAFHHQILGQIIALVEQADGRHPVLNRGTIFAFDRRPGISHSLKHALGHIGPLSISRLVALLVTTGKRKQSQNG
jgi:hypothetical protein